MEMQGIERAVLRSRVWRPVARHLVVPAAVTLTSLPPDGDVLQIGSGAGFETEELARRYPGWRILATDLDSGMVEAAEDRVRATNVRFRMADATALDLADSSFDIVFAALVWHHVPDWRAATSEAGRVLRTGGKLVLLDLVPPRRIARPPVSFARDYFYPALLSALSQAGFERYRATNLGGVAYRLHAVR